MIKVYKNSNKLFKSIEWSSQGTIDDVDVEVDL
jgi:hypothetical protein